MATFTITTAQNIDALTGKTGSDTYNINGGYLTIDQDSYYGLNTSTSVGAMGNTTISATLGGTVHVDGTQIWIIPYTGGSGTMPAYNTVISNGTGSGTLIGVHNIVGEYSLTVPGDAMPASGFIRVKQKTGTFQAGALTGITATASDAGRTGWIEVVGVESTGTTVPRLGKFKVTGAWFSLGLTSGTSNQTLQIPVMLSRQRYCPGVYIEKTSGQGDYEFYPNAGITTSTGTEAARGKVVWISSTGLVRIGNSGAATNGYTPPANLSVVIPNVIFETCTAAAISAVAIPSATISTRHGFATTGGGVIEIDKASMNWYLDARQAYSVTVSNSSFTDAISLSEIASPMTFTNVGVGNKATTALTTSPLTISLCFAGGTFTDCVWARATMGGSGQHVVTLTDISGFAFIRDTARANTNKSNATTYSRNITRANNCTWTTPTIIQGPMSLTTCSNITVTDPVYVNQVSSTTITTYATYIYLLSSNTSNCVFSGGTFPVTNNHPYTALLGITAAGCSNITLRNIGTYASPLNLGTANACAHVLNLATGAAASNVSVKRVYVSNTRTGLITGDNSTSGVVMQNVFGDYGDATDVSPCLNMIQRGLGTVKALTAQTAVYGTHWADYFVSTTMGRIAILMNEPTTNTAPQVSLTGGASFTAAGGLYMPTIGMTATFTMPDYCIGHLGFNPSFTLVMAGGTGTNYTYAYQLDKNDGNGFSAWSPEYGYTGIGNALGTDTNTGVDASKGFKWRFRITTSTTNSTAITAIHQQTISTTTTQAYQYPLDDPRTLTLTGLQTNCDVVILQAGTSTELVNVDQNPTSSYAYSYYYAAGTYVDIGIFKAGYVPFYIRNYLLTDGNASIPVAQTPDRNFS